jgi:DNA adenine methylase
MALDFFTVSEPPLVPTTQMNLGFDEETSGPLTGQLLKWIGSKYRHADGIIKYFPSSINTYREPFLGGGAVLGKLNHRRSVGSDVYQPLVEIWLALKNDPNKLIEWYTDRWHRFNKGLKADVYKEIREAFNAAPNGADLVFLSRSCYGGVVRFRKDGYMSTPIGAHDPISPESFEKRVEQWHSRSKNFYFVAQDFRNAFHDAKRGDLIYCDPPYIFSQSILYGSQSFLLKDLFHEIDEAKRKGVNVALSIDGSKIGSEEMFDILFPSGLFKRQLHINCGRSMLKRFQMEGQTLENHTVKDRLLLTY